MTSNGPKPTEEVKRKKSHARKRSFSAPAKFLEDLAVSVSTLNLLNDEQVQDLDDDTVHTPKPKTSPLSALKQIFTPRKKDESINECYFGKLSLIQPEYDELRKTLSDDDFIVVGKAHYLKRSEDIKELLKLAATKGNFAFFKECEAFCFTNEVDIDGSLLIELNLMTVNQNDKISDYLNEAYGERMKNARFFQ